jgi:glycosyltransferase involved in cell wall biosynthesis
VELAVVVPAYNAAEHLTQTLASVAAQVHPPREVIVVDDGSTDRTAAIADAAGARVIRQANAGVAAARNAGVRAACAPWIAFLDADDRWLPHFTARVAEAARACPDIGAIFTDYALDDPARPARSWFAIDRHYRALPGALVLPGIRRFSRSDVALALARSRSFISTSAFVVRRALFERCGGFDESYRHAEDLELMLRLFAHASVAAIEEPLSIYRKHGGNLTVDEAACITSERRVWRAVIADPHRYAPHLASELERAFAQHVCHDALVALRRGRFAQAAADFRMSARLALTATYAERPAAAVDGP